MNTSESISNALGMKPFEGSSNLPVQVNNTDNDFEYARSNIKSVIEQSNDILPDIIQQVKESATPRSIEVLSEFLRTCVEINKELVALTNNTNTTNNTSTTNNTVVFNGTTDDLQNYFKDKGIF